MQKVANLFKKLKITAKTAHFKIPYGTTLLKTYEAPPPSTVVGILKVIFGEEINDFRFGYRFSHEGEFADIMKVYKVDSAVARKTTSAMEYNATDISKKEYLYDCRLEVYTDIEKAIKLDYCLCLGRSNCLAALRMPIEEIELSQGRGIGVNQYTEKEVGRGMVMPITMYSRYDSGIQAFKHQVRHLRYNKVFENEGYLIKKTNESIFMWHFKDGEVDVCKKTGNI